MTASDHLKQATGSLGGDQIPEDLKGDYDDLVYCKEHRDEGTVFTYYMDGYLSAIERIAKAEASLAQKTRECEELRKHLLQTNKNLQAELENVIALKAQVEQLGRQVAEMEARIGTLIGTTCNRCERGDALFVEPDTGFYTHTFGGNYCDAHRLHSVLNTKVGVEARARTK